MKRLAEECCFLVSLLLIGCGGPPLQNSHEEPQPTPQTILWELDREGFVQFWTNDPQNLDASFVALHGSRCDPMGTVEAEVRKVSGSLMGAFGLAFCMQDDNSGYLLCIDIQGFYSVCRIAGGSCTSLVDWSYSDLLHTGYDAVNTLNVDRAPSTGQFSVFINGTLAATYVDGSYSGGYYGYFADVMSGAYERFLGHPVDVRFRSSGESGIRVSPTSGLVTTEAGGSACFTIVLNGRPSSDVTIALWSSDESEGTVSPKTVTFTPDTWSTPQVVTVTGVDDLLDDEVRQYTIATLPAVSTDAAYNGFDAENVSVSNTDDDPPLAPSGLSATAVSGTQNDLAWIDNATNEAGFAIERKLGTDGAYAQIATLLANVTAYSDVGLARAPNVIYYYRVRAYHAGGASPWSPAASTIRNITTYGSAAAIDGDYAVVGPTATAAAAMIFHRTGANGWDSGIPINASDGEPSDAFGSSLAISGDYVIVGASREDQGGTDAGAAYVFHRTGLNSWDSGTKILAPDAEASDWFGGSVAISGDYAIVGAVKEASGGGAAYIFHRTGPNAWDSGTKLQTHPFSFGCSVAIDGDDAVVGATIGYPGTGAAYIFHRTDVNAWDGGTQVLPVDGGMNDMFGCSAAISGDYAIVGADSNDARGLDAGAAYIFHRTGVNNWDAGTKITGADSQAYDYFGRRVSIRGDYAVVGAEGEDQGGDYAGAVYVFHRIGLTSWDGGFKHYVSPGLLGGFGRSVSTDGTRTIVVGYGAYVVY